MHLNVFVQASVFCDKKIEKTLAYYGISSKLQVKGKLAGGRWVGYLLSFFEFRLRQCKLNLSGVYLFIFALKTGIKCWELFTFAKEYLPKGKD